MLCFYYCTILLDLYGPGILHLWFIAHLTGKKPRLQHLILCLILLTGIGQLGNWFALPQLYTLTLWLLALYAISRYLLQNNARLLSWTAALIAIYISQLAFGIVNAVESLLFPGVLGQPLLYPLVLAATLAALILTACSYWAVLNTLSLPVAGQPPYLGLLLLPSLFFSLVELYLLRTFYQSLCLTLTLAEIKKHLSLLAMQLLGLGTLFCVLFAYQYICRSFQDQAMLLSLSQAVQSQKIYIAEAKLREEQTRAFRHDIKNHLTVLSGLLNHGQLQAGSAYLNKLQAAADSLFLPYQTGNPVVDILLGEKLRLAENSGISAEVSLLLPSPCCVDDVDLCVLFANALDNAIHACQEQDGTKILRITGERQGDFYRLQFENSCVDTTLPPMGIGLSNIKAIVEKYHGAFAAEKAGGCFTLNILLNISLHPGDIPRQMP